MIALRTQHKLCTKNNQARFGPNFLLCLAISELFQLFLDLLLPTCRVMVVLDRWESFRHWIGKYTSYCAAERSTLQHAARNTQHATRSTQQVHYATRASTTQAPPKHQLACNMPNAACMQATRKHAWISKVRSTLTCPQYAKAVHVHITRGVYVSPYSIFSISWFFLSLFFLTFVSIGENIIEW